MALYVRGGDKLVDAVLAYEALSFGREPELISAVWSDGGDDRLVLTLVYKITSESQDNLRRYIQTRLAVVVDPTEESPHPDWSTVLSAESEEKDK